MRKTYRLIGDVHGKFGPYKTIAKEAERSIVLGDMGVGFRKLNWDGRLKWSSNPPHDFMTTHGCEYFRGNHDAPDVCARDSKCIPDGTVRNDVMIIGGAVSIDKHLRTSGIDFWENEECSMTQLHHFLDVYDMVRPRVMLTHECPESIAGTMMADFNRTKFEIPSRTRQALQAMFEIHQPELWCFGHWHVNWHKEINGTKFFCLNELSYMDVDL